MGSLRETVEFVLALQAHDRVLREGSARGGGVSCDALLAAYDALGQPAAGPEARGLADALAALGPLASDGGVPAAAQAKTGLRAALAEILVGRARAVPGWVLS